MLVCVSTAGAQHARSISRETPQRPNILVVLVDDLDVRAMDLLLARGALPNLQKEIVDQGFAFTNAFATMPLCGPSRATFLTGQYSHNHGVLHNSRLGGGTWRKLRDGSTVATWLQAAGYRNGYLGKYLNEYGLPGSYVPPGWNDWQALLDPTTYKVYDYLLTDNGVVVPFGSRPEDYQTDVLTRRARRFLLESEAEDSKPFFLYVNPLAPHVELGETMGGCERWDLTIRPAPRHVGTFAQEPLVPGPAYNEQDVTDKPALFRSALPWTSEEFECLQRFHRDRLESMLAVDDMIGTLVDTLKELGELDHTWIFFTSDNGHLIGEHRLIEKTWAYEESARIPLYVRAPGLAPRVVPEIVLNNDLAPTLAEIAGATPTHVVDGRSILPLLENPGLPWRRHFLIEFQPSGRFFEAQRYSAVRTLFGNARGPDSLYVAWNLGGEREYYRLTTDPYELESQHANPATARERQVLEGFAQAFATSSGARCRELEDMP